MSDDLTHEFVAEATEHLGTAEAILLEASRAPAQVDDEAVNACFRALHTVKGCAGFLDLPRIQRIAHAGEQVLDALRTHRIVGSEAIFDLLLGTVSRMHEQVAHLREAGGELPGDDADWIANLQTAANGPTCATTKRHARASFSKALEALITALTGNDVVLIHKALAEVAARVTTAGLGAAADQRAGQMLFLADRLEGSPEGRDETIRAIHELAQSLHDGGTAPVSVTLKLEAAPASTQTELLQPDAQPPLGDAAAESLSESQDLLSQAEALALGREHLVSAEIDSIFRNIHTVKGMAAFVGHDQLEHAAHSLESKLIPVRDGTQPADASVIQMVLVGIDMLRREVARLQGGNPDNGIAQTGTERLGDLLVEQGVPRAVIEEAAANAKPGQRLGERLLQTGKVSRQQVERAVQAQQAQRGGNEGFSRVATSKLEELMTQVGELLIAQAMVQHDPELTANPRLAQAVGRQGRILRNLQMLSLSLRMVPLKGTFQKMARAVYDTAKKLGKQIDLRLSGEDTEIDRTLAELMADPLLHMVRNAADHGIEMPALRRERGKSEQGKLELSAFHAGDDVVIRLADDGGGMDPVRLRAKAVEKGLIDPNRVLTDQECFQLIFLPGFSTAAQVTDVSGRGVGMDVVRRQVQAAHGVVSIESELGKGTTFTIRLPLTTAILDGMLLTAGNQCFMLPISSIIEMLRPAEGQVNSLLNQGRVIEHRGRTLPVVLLGELMGISEYQRDPTRSILVIVDNHGSDVALQIDDILGQRQVVIKPFDANVPHHAALSGTAILGDGHVGLILDPAHITKLHG